MAGQPPTYPKEIIMDRYRQPQDHKPPQEPHVDSPATHRIAMDAWQRQLNAINGRRSVDVMHLSPGSEDPIKVETFETPDIEPIVSVLMQAAKAFMPMEQAVQSTANELVSFVDAWVEDAREPGDGEAWIRPKDGHVVFATPIPGAYKMRLRHVGVDSRTTTVKKGHFLKGYVRLEDLRTQQAQRVASAEQLNAAVAEAVAS